MTRGLNRMDALPLLLAVASALSACVYRPTEVIVALNTDIAPDRLLSVNIRVIAGTMGTGETLQLVRGEGVPGAVRFPATFAIVPRDDGPRDATVTLVLEAYVAPGANGESAVRFRRSARFQFTPRETTALPVFLSVQCGSTATGCRAVPANQCTLSALCEDRDTTCGDRGACVSVTTPTIPNPSADSAVWSEFAIPGARDAIAAADGTIDAGDVQRLDVLDTGAVLDTGPSDALQDVLVSDVRPDGCVRNCTDRNCGSDGCGGACGTCAAGQSCGGAGVCVTSCTRDCVGRNCGGDGCGGSCGDCLATEVCSGNRCACAPTCGTRNCGNDGCSGSCGMCAAGEYCSGTGRCRTCASSCGTRVCGPDPVCGESCGSCAAPSTCDGSGQCTCVPNCGTRVCGPDGCGGSCGSCGSLQVCDGAGRCCRDCSAYDCGSDFCAGSCGACIAPGRCMGGFCI